MNKVYQFIRFLKLQVLSSIGSAASARRPGFPIFLALIILVLLPFLLPPQYGTRISGTLFERTNEGFRVVVPQGWVIDDLNNTGSTLIQESAQGYRILAQLCPAEGQEEGQQQQGTTTNVNGSATSSSCTQQPQGEIIHIIRFPNLGARLGIAVTDIRNTIPDSIFEYEIQKLQDVGYRNINIVNTNDTSLLVRFSSESPVMATVPARILAMTYSTSAAPNETRTGYFILTATNVTPPNLETITGYSIFYEGPLAATAAIAQEKTPTESFPPPRTALIQIVNSFELTPSQEAQVLIESMTQRQISSSQRDEAGKQPSQLTSAIQHLDITSVMIIIAYSLLVIGVVWKFIIYIREKPGSRSNEIF